MNHSVFIQLKRLYLATLIAVVALVTTPLYAQAVEPATATENIVVQNGKVIRIHQQDDGRMEISVDGKNIFDEINLPEKWQAFIETKLDRLIEQVELTEEDKQIVLEQLSEGIEIEINADAKAAKVDSSTDHKDSGISILEAVVAIVAISFTLGLPVIIVLLVLYFSYKKRKQKNAIIERLIDSGQPLSEDLLKSIETPAKTTFQKGIGAVAIGIGLIILLGVTANWNVATIGLLPLLIGVGRLISWKYENSQP